jgi:multidrug efflux pump subunit AcrA (membrane-fusion protein)
MQITKPSPRRPNWPNSIPSLPTNTKRARIYGFALIGFAVGGFGLWSATVPIASAVVANGQVVVASKRKQIQHPTGGAVRAIKVEDGQHVREGDVLLELDDADALERYTRGRDSYFLGLATEARMQAEIAEATEPQFPQELKEAAERMPAVKSLLEGQAQLLLNDLHEYGVWLQVQSGERLAAGLVAARWRAEVLEPTLIRLRPHLASGRDALQAYCDALEHKWILSERAGADVGLDAAVADYIELGAPAPESARAGGDGADTMSAEDALVSAAVSAADEDASR